MSHQSLYLKGDNLDELYDACDIIISCPSNSIRISRIVATDMKTKEKTEHIYTAAMHIYKEEINQAKEITDDKVDKLLTISKISNSFNDLIYEYTKEYFR